MRRFWWEETPYALYAAISVSVLLCLKFILFDDCFGFDTNDDVNHTFVGLHVAKQALSAGELPRINLFNNFGTPLIGDAQTLPFALQSLTYWFVDYPLAMSINRLLIGFFTTLALVIFFRQFFDPWIAILCSLLTLFAPGPFWTLAHHHYQASLLFFTLILLIQSSQKLTFRWRCALLFVCYIMFYYSVSIHVVSISIPFIVGYLVFKNNWRVNKHVLSNTVILILAAAATLPATYEFKELISVSTRMGWSPYSGILPTIREQFLGLLIPPGEWMYFGINGHFSINTYFSIALIFAAIAGFLVLLSNRRKNTGLFLLVFMLGFVPATLAFGIQFNGERMSLFNSVDMTRVWWFSNMFVMLAVGSFLKFLCDSREGYHGRLAFITYSVCLFVPVMLQPSLAPELDNIGEWHIILLMLPIFLVGLWLISTNIKSLTMYPRVHTRKKTFLQFNPAFGAMCVAFCLILSLVPTMNIILGASSKNCSVPNHYFALSNKATFQPNHILDAMKPYSRMASVISPVRGFDLKAVFGDVLGSNARALVANQRLRRIFEKQRLIQIDDTYFFSPPWQFDKLSALGIRYLLTPGPDKSLEKNNWKVVSQDTQRTGLKLYENPDQPSIVRYKHKGRWLNLHNFSLRPNGISIELPNVEKASLLQIAFFNREGWLFNVDGEKVESYSSDLGMIEIPFMPDNKTVEVVYRGIPIPLWVRAVFYLSVFAFVSLLWLGPSRRRSDAS
ncbi:MAG: hypothetical protein VYA17_14715 [Pseudomonadota bacterium]|nr:hypothetical protein [Pseudomonadota bacterium]